MSDNTISSTFRLSLSTRLESFRACFPFSGKDAPFLLQEINTASVVSRPPVILLTSAIPLSSRAAVVSSYLTFYVVSFILLNCERP